MKNRTLLRRVEQSLAVSKADVFLRSDFAALGGYDQVGRALRQMITKGKLVSGGYGIYVRARRSFVTGNTIPVQNAMQVAKIVLKRCGIGWRESQDVQRYRTGKTTQIPVNPILMVDRRVTRKIGFSERPVELICA